MVGDDRVDRAEIDLVDPVARIVERAKVGPMAVQAGLDYTANLIKNMAFAVPWSVQAELVLGERSAEFGKRHHARSV